MTGLTAYGCDADEAARFRELSPCFGVTPTITSAAVSATTIAAAVGNRCVSVGHKSDITAALLGALRAAGVEHVSTRSIGVDHIDLAAADALGITVENVTYAPDGVADFTLMLILMAIRNAQPLLQATHRRDFRLSPVRGRDLRDLTVGVVGVGNIGSAVVERLTGFGCRVLATTSGVQPPVAAEVASFDELVRESDVVTLHVPLDVETHHLVGRRQLASMRPGAILVNTGRGALVDTEALVDALERGALGGAALDVLEGEDGIFYSDCSTRTDDHPLLPRLQALPNVIVTPHTAFHTERMLRDTVETTLVKALHHERNRVHGEAHGRHPVRGVLGGA